MIQKMLKIKFLAAVLLAGALSACTETSKLEEVVMPVAVEETAGFPRQPIKTDTTYTLRVLYRPENGCGRFARLDSVLENPNKRLMTVFAAYPVEGQEAICSDQARLISVSFKFRAQEPGKYYFHFWQSSGTVLIDSLEAR
ncbi:hypothetical protein EFA69_18335 [Rufibacter immobilis]|uniref:Lipoprotein n=1 Tax=Rufibacter immobilis TaxID=1348778 RepID=A0A3M9MRB4_9BACT|nr:hypothetical protein [Rufibacter immobilis]RNI28041.1 hypothetical protein EFA69_18335 [Rufibacter immobilis]